MNWQGRKKVLVKKLRDRDYADLFRLIKRRLFINFLLRPIGIPFALLLMPLLYGFKFFKPFLVTVLHSDRIGHLALNTELFLRRKQLGRMDCSHATPIFLLKYGRTANHQLLTMFKRNLVILEKPGLFWLYMSIDWILNRTGFTFALPMEDNEDYEFKKAETSLILTKEENKKGGQLLKEIGVDLDKDWFVCIHSRDGAYLAKQNPGVNWKYHDYRDSDINDFTDAIKYIVDKGGYIVRMGSEVDQPLKFQHDRVIDYAVKCRSDFMDIYLIAKCRFFLGTTGGICDVATAMNKPRISVNYCPPGIALFGKDSLYIPKKLKSKRNGSYLTLSKALQEGWDKLGIDYNELGYEYEDNTPQEILEVTKEMLARLDGSFKLSEEDENLIQKYFDLFKPNNLSYKVKTPIGLHFLKNKPELIW